LNHLGTPRAMTDENGNVVWKADYKPFGEAEVAGDVENRFRFPGQYWDGETGLHYNWHRYYDSGIGRYLTGDPIGLEGGINIYSFVNNNPINLIDPSGLEFLYDKSDQMLYWIEGPFESDTPEIIAWDAVTGPYGNGPLPNGWYNITGLETPANSESNSMTDSCSNKYKFRLHPQFNTNRSGLLIHPDGGVSGTARCIGAKGCTKSLKDFINFHLDKPSGRGNLNSDASLTLYVRD